MFYRHEGEKFAVLVHIFFPNEKNTADLIEFKSLVTSADIKAVYVITGNSRSPHAKYFVGEGKALEIAEAVKIRNSNIVIFDHTLSSSQERNLERLCQCQVIDRTGLILYIFSQRARTHEGKLQVELAKLRHISTRLVHGWTHLERQKGGIGLRGIGETQLETDRRLIRNKIRLILSRLTKVDSQRERARQARYKAGIPTISFVGYTNAGKSSLFNQITKSEVYSTYQLFATLDPTLRKININDFGTIILADTVGFIRYLPHDLIAAFKSTLHETRESSLLLHVVDSTDNRMEENILVVKNVLEEIKANKIPVLLVMNKIDMFNRFTPRIDRDENNLPFRVWLSAKTGEGIPLLLQALTEHVHVEIAHYELRLPPESARLRSKLYKLQAIKHEEIDKDGNIMIEVKLPIVDWRKLSKQEQSLLDYIVNVNILNGVNKLNKFKISMLPSNLKKQS